MWIVLIWGRFSCRVFEMGRVVNWVGVAAGVATLLVVVVSFFVPWWQLTVGENLLNVNASPVNTNFGLFGTQFTLPLIVALNLISILTFVCSGTMMLTYSVIPTKPYAKHLLGFSYKKPLYALIAFLISLAAIVSLAGVFGLSIPFIGAADVALPESLSMGVSVSASVLASFLFPFWLAVAASVLCIAARVYHGRVIARKQNS